MKTHSRRTAIGTMMDVPSGRIHVREDGGADAPVVVLLHGFASSLHWFDRLVPLLSDGYRVIRLDLLGNGCTIARHPTFGAEAQASMALSVLDELGVEDFVPVGHSFGSDVAIAMAEQSGRASRIVILGQAPDYTTATLPVGHSLLNQVSIARVLQALTAFLPDSYGGAGFAHGFRPDLAFPDPGQMGADLRAMDPRTCRAVLSDRGKTFRDRPLDARLRELGLPTMAILGGRDQMYPLVPTKARYDALPGVRVEVVERSGHSPNVEAPEDVARLLQDFLTDLGPESQRS